MRVGVLALQGDFQEHLRALDRCGVTGVAVKTAADLEDLAARVLPGGESTTFARLIERHGLAEPLRALAARGTPIMGTCAGLILMARGINAGANDQLALGLLDVTVERNAFGRQVDSFEAPLDIPALGKQPFRGVFIRAPVIQAIGSGVEPLVRLDDAVVAVQDGPRLGLAFHPELSGDQRFHRYFLSLVGWN